MSDLSAAVRHERTVLAMSVALVAAVAAGCYWGTLDVPWYLDDVGAIVRNPTVQDLGGALRAALRPRGLTVLTFALDYARSGLDVGAFHVTNIALHVAASALALLLLRRAFPGRPGVALLAALVFAAHPVQTQAVTYVVQRLAILSGLLALAATRLYLDAADALSRGVPARSGRFVVPYAAAVGSGAAALLAKENAATLPLLLVVAELTLPGRRGLPARRLAWIVPFALLPALLAARALGPSLLGVDDAGSAAALTAFDSDVVGRAGNVTPIAYLATELEVVWRYARLVVWPVGQMLDAGIEVAPDPLRAGTLLAGTGLVGLVVAALLLRRRVPLASFGILWFLAALSVESSVIPLDPYFEHRLYLPMLGAAAVLGAILAELTDGRLIAAVGALVVVPLCALTVARNAEWRDPVRLWAADLRHGSASYRSAFGLADAYRRAGDEVRARETYRELLARGGERCRAIGCGPRYRFNLGVAAERVGDPVTAAAYYASAVRDDPGYAAAHFGLGVTAYAAGSKREALDHFRRASELAPGDAMAAFNLATVALELGDPAPARQHLARIRAYDPALAAELETGLARLGDASRRP